MEIYHDGAWGTVCGVGFGNEEGDVICRQLGHLGLVRLIPKVNELERGESTIVFFLFLFLFCFVFVFVFCSLLLFFVCLFFFKSGGGGGDCIKRWI